MDCSDVRQSVFAVFRNSLFDDYFSIIVPNDPLDFSKNAVVDKHVPDIDVELRFSNAVGLMGDFYDRYKKNIFFAFPFDVDDHEFYTQLAGGRAHSTGEKIRICPMDFTIAEEWLAVEGEDGRIGIRSEDMPVFHLSQINYNRFLKSPEYPKSHVYLYAASNRTNNLNFCTPEDCCGTYHLTILMQNVVFLIMQLIDNRIFIRPFTKKTRLH